MNNTQRVVLGLLILSVLGLAITGAQIYSRLTYLWLFFLLGNWVWSLLSLRGLVVTREPRIRRGHMGQIFEERYEVSNPGFMPRLWVEIKDLSTLPGSRGSHVVSLLSSGQRRTYLARTRLLKRGVFPLGPTIVASGDPFGIFPVKKELPYEDSVLVYPMIFELNEFPNPPGLLAGGESLRRRTHYVTPNASGVREYAPGDSMSRIHWPTSVRRDKLMVKEFELDPMSDIWVFVDAEHEVQAELPYQLTDLATNIFLRHESVDMRLPPSTEEYAASIAASLCKFFLRRRRSVGLVFSGQATTILPPDRGGRQLGKILDALAIFKCSGSLPMLGMIEAQVQHIARGSTVLLVTPTTRPQLSLAVDYVARRGLRPVVVLLDSESFGGQPGSKELAFSIKSRNIPVRLVSNGEDLRTALVLNISPN